MRYWLWKLKGETRMYKGEENPRFITFSCWPGRWLLCPPELLTRNILEKLIEVSKEEAAMAMFEASK